MPAEPAPSQLYVCLETDSHGSGLERLEAVLAAGREAVACVLLRPPPGGRLGHGELQTAIQRLQAHGLAVLIEDDAELAHHAGADGVHLSALGEEALVRARYAIARSRLGGGRTVGASAGLSRHLAMVLGEIGADYVAFEPEATGLGGETVIELAQWWASLFEVPVVALGVESAVEAEQLAAGGVEFIGVALGAGRPETMARHVALMAEAIAAAGSLR